VALPWSVVTESEALSHAGTPTRSLPADGVTYVIGPLAMLIIVEAGDRPFGNAVKNGDSLMLREPFPEEADARLQTWDLPKLGFVRVPEGCVPLGELGSLRSTGGRAGRAEWRPLINCELRITNPLDFDVLDRVRPTTQRPLPDIGWLRLLHLDPIAALTRYVAGWYADIPPLRHWIGHPGRVLPEPLVAFYQAAAGRREVYGVCNQIFPADLLQDEDDGLLTFGAENQGVFDMTMDPADRDPRVRCDWGANPEYEREPLSRFLLQFLLVEAAVSSPFQGFAKVTAEQAARMVESLSQVPLQPLRWPTDPTHFAVAPGLVVMTSEYPDGSVDVCAGSRHRCALRPLREPGFVWERFDG
jgi:hypothetical protein